MAPHSALYEPGKLLLIAHDEEIGQRLEKIQDADEGKKFIEEICRRDEVKAVLQNYLDPEYRYGHHWRAEHDRPHALTTKIADGQLAMILFTAKKRLHCYGFPHDWQEAEDSIMFQLRGAIPKCLRHEDMDVGGYAIFAPNEFFAVPSVNSDKPTMNAYVLVAFDKREDTKTSTSR